MPHKVQVQAATVAGHGKSRVVEKVLFSEEQGTVSYSVFLRVLRQLTSTGIQYNYTVAIKYSHKLLGDGNSAAMSSAL